MIAIIAIIAMISIKFGHAILVTCPEYSARQGKNGYGCRLLPTVGPHTDKCKIQCPANQEIYMEGDSNYCPTYGCRKHGYKGLEGLGRCVWPGNEECGRSKDKLIETCDGLNKCEFYVNKTMFGDPSEYCRKELIFNYKCICIDGWRKDDNGECNKCTNDNVCKKKFGQQGYCNSNGDCARCGPHDGEECNGNGICNADAKCKCKQGWKGEFCDKKECGPLDNPCNGRGKCDYSTGFCKNCQQGWVGLQCEEARCGPYDGRLEQCYKNGECNKQTGQCQCNRNGLSPDEFCKCDITRNDQCLDTEICDFRTGHCLCKQGWSGEYCNKCSSDEQCQNGGHCDENTKKCKCSDDYMGADCSANIKIWMKLAMARARHQIPFN